MNEQDEALLLDHVEGDLQGAELARAQALLAADAKLAASVEAMRADREGLHRLGEATAKVATQAGPLPDAVQAALAKWNGGVAASQSQPLSPVGFVGPSPAGEDVPSENHVWQPKKHRRVWHVELIVAYGGIAAMLVVGALAVLSPDGETRQHRDYSDRMPSMSMATHDDAAPSAPVLADEKRADRMADSAKDLSDQKGSAKAGADAGQMALASRTGERDMLPEAVKTQGAAAPVAAPVAAAPAAPMGAAEPAKAEAKPADRQLALSGAAHTEATNVDAPELKKEKAAAAPIAPTAAPREAQYDKDGREMSPARAAAAADRIAAREEANARARATPMGPAALAAVGPNASGASGGMKRDDAMEPAEVIVDTVSTEVAMKIVTEWAKLHQVAVENTSHKAAARGGRADKPAAGKPADAGTDRITMVLTSAELSELILRLNGARETSAKLDSAPPAVKGYVSAMLARPSVAYSVAELPEEGGAGAQKPEDKKDEEAKKAAASQPDKNSAQANRAVVEAPQSVRTSITFREGKAKK